MSNPTPTASPTTTLTVHPKMSENALLGAVLSLFHLYEWRTLHIRPARTAQGYRTALQGDGVGWPDILAVKGERMLAVELKSEKGTLTMDQNLWLHDLQRTGAEAFVWRPSDWFSGEILRVLSA